MDHLSDSTDMSLSKLQPVVKYREAWHTEVHGIAKVRQDLATEQQQKCAVDSQLLAQSS